MASGPDLAFESTRRLTREEFVTWLAARPERDSNRYELLHGRVVMTPPARHPHGLVEGTLATILGSFVRERRLGVVLGSSQGFDLPTGDTVEPDLSFVSAERWQAVPHVDGAFLRVVPDLVVEILSPSTAPRDRGAKRDLYEQSGVREYWIVDPRAREVTVLRLRDGAFAPGRVHASGTVLSSPLLPELALDVASIFPAEPPAG